MAFGSLQGLRGELGCRGEGCDAGVKVVDAVRHRCDVWEMNVAGSWWS